MNIGIVTHNFPSFNEEGRAAAGNFVVPLCLELGKRGNIVCVLTPDVAKKKDDYPFVVERFGACSGDKLLGHHKLYNPFDLYRLWAMLDNGSDKLNWLIEKYDIEVLLAMWAFPAGFLCSRTKKKIPYYTWCLGSDIWTLGKVPIVRMLVSEVLKRSKRVYADGLQLAVDAKKLSGCSCEFLPTTRFRDDINPICKYSASSITTFLYVGRWEKAKAPDLFLHAAKICLQKRSDVRFKIFGGGSLEEDIREFGLQLHKRFGDRFIIGGYLSESEFKQELSQASCFVIPSRMESIPIALTDAVSAGVPVIVSDAGDMGYWVKKFGLGIVFSKGDLAGLLEGLDSMIEKRFEIQQENREAYLKTFSIGSVVDSLLCDLREFR